MSLLQVLRYPDQRLRTIAEPVVNITDTIGQLVEDMFDTMYANNGIGLAAPQVAINQRIIVIDISDNHNQPVTLINPQLLDTSGKTGINEGCLSIPNQRGFVLRDQTIKISYLDLTGNSFEIEVANLLAICIQHEMDHLVGKLFIDYLSPLKRQLIHKQMEKSLG